MGCDIHMYAEKRNSKTGKWELLVDKFLDDYKLAYIINYISKLYGLDDKETNKVVLNYFKGVKPKNKLDLHIYGELSKVVTDDPEFEWWQQTEGGKFAHPKNSEPYMGRNYNLFGVLGNVRNYDNLDPIFSDRYIPNDTSKEICDMVDSWDIDGHSHNYLYLDEIIDSVYYNMSDDELNEIGVGTRFFRGAVDSLLELGNPEDIRIIFWFDN